MGTGTTWVTPAIPTSRTGRSAMPTACGTMRTTARWWPNQIGVPPVRIDRAHRGRPAGERSPLGPIRLRSSLCGQRSGLDDDAPVIPPAGEFRFAEILRVLAAGADDR